MAEVGAPRTHEQKFNFIIEIGGVESAAFQDCSELSAEVAKIEQWEGGALIPDKQPGRVTWSDLTLSRGAVSNDTDLLSWFEEVVRSAAGTGNVSPQFKRDLDIVVKDRDGAELKRWRCTNAWPMKFVAGDWDNTSDENTIEQVVLTYDYAERIQST